jgi:MoaA/NifB/PqqE/SkfB family radical SAM enzyme
MSGLSLRKLFFCNYWTTYRCNSKCEFCNIWKDPKLQNLFDAKFSDVRKNLNDLKKMGVKVIDFTGGEPLLNKDLPEILSYAKKLGFFIKLSTNGILYPERADELKGLPDRIYFSLDAISPDEYKKIRGVEGYDKLLESIDITKRMRQDICLFYTATDENIKNIQNIITFSQKNKTTLFIHPCFNYFNNKELDKKNITLIKKFFWEPYVRMNLPQLEFHYQGGNNPQKPSCKVGISTIDISPDDCLTIPCFHRHLKKVKINGNLYSIYKSDRWNEFFKNAGRYDFCKNCTIDCYFGLSYADRLSHYFLKQNLSYLKLIMETIRNK